MNPIIPKNQMTEEDIKLNYITPSIINRGWDGKITMEAKVTDGRMNLKGNIASREPAKRADYILHFTNEYNPIAVIEAKDNKQSVSHGIQQAMEYARMMDIPFAYSSNGNAFYEHDFFTGQEKEIPLDQFPTYDELCERYKAGANNGQGLTQLETDIIAQLYYTGTGQNDKSPRYYQRVAINRAVDAIAKGRKRLLLVMATGTGKTYTAFQIVYRLLKTGVIKKVLYLADRNILVDQSIQQDFAPLGNSIHKVNFSKDDPATITSHEVYFSLYQQLADREEQRDDDDDDGEAVSRLSRLFKPDFFDLVIVDECHRGSAKKDSNWRSILEYFSSAVQIGMTATPKETTYVSNIDYFGEPIYTYSLHEGIDDGFLAPFRVISINIDIDRYWRPDKGQKDIYGDIIEDRIYNNSDYDKNIIMEDRVNRVAERITEYLKHTDRMQKTIVFCQDEDHALRMRNALINLNADMVQKNPDYVVRITGSDDYGKDKLDYFISVAEKFPVIATTSKLLSTGADCKMTKLIVIDQKINSMTEFKQIIGRGTRLREEDGKTHFTVMDFRDASRLFADPEWDGPIEIISDFDPDIKSSDESPEHTESELELELESDPESEWTPKPYVDVDGCPVSIVRETVSIYDKDNKLLRKENIIDYTKTNILGTYASLDNFIRQWTSEQKKEKIQELFRERGIDLDALKIEQGMEDVDDFDFICHVAFDQKPLTRKERANNVKKRDFLSKYGDDARQVLEALLDKYMNIGIYQIESMDVLKLDPLRQYGSPARIVAMFGGRAEYLKAIHELGEELYNIG